MTHAENVGHELLEQVIKRPQGEGMNVAAQIGTPTTEGGEGAVLAIASGRERAMTGTPTQAVGKLLAANRGALGVAGRNVSLRRVRGVSQSDIVVRTFEPRVAGLRVHGARVAFGVARNRRQRRNQLLAMTSDKRVDGPVEGRFGMSGADAIRCVAADLGVDPSDREIDRLLASEHVRLERVLAAQDNGLRRALRITPVGLITEHYDRNLHQEPAAPPQFVIDADSGEILAQHAVTAQAAATVSAYDENPVKTPRNIDRVTTIVDGRPSDIADGANTLINDFFDVVPGQYLSVNGSQLIKERSGRAEDAGGSNFLYKYNDRPNIAEANTFVHLNRARELLLRIDPSFTTQTVAPSGQAMRVYVDVDSPAFNAYSHRDGHLEFLSTDGVGAAEDADIVVHEYGHQVHFVLAPHVYASEVGEGVADLIASVYAHDTAISELFPNRDLVKNGDILGTAFEPPATELREIYNDFRYPEDYAGSGHARSRILSGALMELHHGSFREFGDLDYFIVPRALLAALPLMPAGAGLLDAAGTFAGLVALVAIFSGKEPWVRLAVNTNRVFTRRGLI